MSDKSTISKGRLYTGAAILVIGFTSPLLIPFVTNTNWSLGVKGTVSGLLALGIPEVFTLISIGILGKQGFEYLKDKLLHHIKPLAPPHSVSLGRYRIGLIMFITPLVIGWVLPYMANLYPILSKTAIGFYIFGDLLFLLSFFVLGGNFWDKFSSLFKHAESPSST